MSECIHARWFARFFTCSHSNTHTHIHTYTHSLTQTCTHTRTRIPLALPVWHTMHMQGGMMFLNPAYETPGGAKPGLTGAHTDGAYMTPVSQAAEGASLHAVYGTPLGSATGEPAKHHQSQAAQEQEYKIPYYASSAFTNSSSGSGNGGGGGGSHYTVPSAFGAGGADYMTPHSAYEQPVSAYAALSQDHVRYEAPQGAKRSGGLRGEECHYEVVDAKQRREQGQGMGRQYMQPVPPAVGLGQSTYVEPGSITADSANANTSTNTNTNNTNTNNNSAGVYIDASTLAEDQPVMLYGTTVSAAATESTYVDAADVPHATPASDGGHGGHGGFERGGYRRSVRLARPTGGTRESSL